MKTLDQAVSNMTQAQANEIDNKARELCKEPREGRVMEYAYQAARLALDTYHAQFELVKGPLGYRARHKVTGKSYQAHDIATSPQRGAE